MDVAVSAKITEFLETAARASTPKPRRALAAFAAAAAPAILLLLAMRQAGLFVAEHGALGGGSSPGVPKRIVHYWHSSNLPPDVREIMTSWRRKHPDYEYVLFDDATAANFLRRHSSKEATVHGFQRGSTPG